MNGLVKSAHRVLQTCVKSSSLTSALVGRSQAPVKRDFTRGIWHMSSKRLDGTPASMSLLHNHSNTCSCGCGLKALHTKEDVKAVNPKPLGEKELVEYLTERIVAERKEQKLKTLPTEVDGFVVKTDGAEVTLTKQLKDEKIEISFIVSHSLDEAGDNDEFVEFRSKPQFDVDIVRGDYQLCFTCSFLQEPSGDSNKDIFGIDEVTFYKEEWNEKVFAIAGDALDEYLYDLLMNLLEEKGVSNAFVQKMSDFSTEYENAAYITLLESISKFIIGKK